MKRQDYLSHPIMCIVNVLLCCKGSLAQQYEFALMCAKRMGYNKVDTATIAGATTRIWWKIHK